MNTTTESNPTEVHATIKLGIDAHAKWPREVRSLLATPRRPQQLEIGVVEHPHLVAPVQIDRPAGAVGGAAEVVGLPAEAVQLEAIGRLAVEAVAAAEEELPRGGAFSGLDEPRRKETVASGSTRGRACDTTPPAGGSGRRREGWPVDRATEGLAGSAGGEANRNRRLPPA